MPNSESSPPSLTDARLQDTPEADPRTRRFYRHAEAGPSPDGDGYAVLLDGRPARAPGRGLLRLPSAPLAREIAAEWQAQGETIRPDAMPLTRLANTTLERVAPGRSALIEALLTYAEADVLCYRAPAPAGLADRQARAWQPVLDWAEASLSARLVVTEGLMPARQSPEALAALGNALRSLDDWTLTAGQAIAAAAGSLVLALAVLRGRLDGEACFVLSRMDELWQAERWGNDREARRAREAVRLDILAADRFWRLARNA